MSAYKHANSDPLEELKRFKNPNIIRCLIRELYTENSYTYKKLQTENRKIKTLIKKLHSAMKRSNLDIHIIFRSYHGARTKNEPLTFFLKSIFRIISKNEYFKKDNKLNNEKIVPTYKCFKEFFKEELKDIENERQLNNQKPEEIVPTFSGLGNFFKEELSEITQGQTEDRKKRKVEELEEEKSIINDAISIKKKIPKVTPNLCKNKAYLPSQPRRQAACKASKIIKAVMSEEAKTNKAGDEKIAPAKKARRNIAAPNDKVMTEIEPVEIIAPAKKVRINNVTDEVITETNEVENLVPVEEARAEYEAPAPNLSKWDLMKNSYDELEKWLSKENEAVEQVAPVEETRTNYEAAEELVITNKVPGETTSAVTIS